MALSPEQVTAFYADRLQQHGATPMACDWSPNGQGMRFDAIARALHFDRKVVLDLGCGVGHLAEYIHIANSVEGVYERHGKPNLTYHGIDASHAMLAEARRLKPDGAFTHGDVLTMELPQTPTVVSNGMLNLDTGTNRVDMARLIAVAWRACTSVCAITMLSRHAPDPKPDRFYYDPGWALDEAFRHTPKVRLDHCYLPNDFCLALYR